MSLKNKYNLLYFLFCLVGCCIGGFTAVFLQYKGVSNTQIGLVTGIGCVSSLALGPCAPHFLQKLSGSPLTSCFTPSIALLRWPFR